MSLASIVIQVKEDGKAVLKPIGDGKALRFARRSVLLLKNLLVSDEIHELETGDIGVIEACDNMPENLAQYVGETAVVSGLNEEHRHKGYVFLIVNETRVLFPVECFHLTLPVVSE